MRLLVLGATGPTGRVVVHRAAQRDHEIVALVRDPARAHGLPIGRLIKGDARDDIAVDAALADVDAVISCLGVGKGDGRATTVVSEATDVLIDRMEAAGVQRLVAMSNIGAGGSGDPVTRLIVQPLVLRWLLPLVADKTRMEQRLTNSNLRWTSVRLPHISSGPTHRVRTSQSGRRLHLWITDTAVADFMLDAVEKELFINQTPSISR